MSHIPNSAMPQAGTTTNDNETATGSTGSSAFGQIADKAREYPKTSIAAGAAVAAGVVAAAAIGVRSRNNGKTGGGAKSKKD